MANPQLSVELSAKIDNLRDGFNKAINEIGVFDKKAKTKLSAIDKQFEKLANDIEKSTSKASTNASRNLASIAATSEKMGGSVAAGSNRAAFALQNLGRVAQDAPFGFIGIQNNLNPLLESFQALRKESGSNVGALKALGSSLMGAGGIGLALSAVTAALTFAQMGMRAWGDTTKDVKKEAEDFSKSLGAVDSALLKGAKNAETQLVPLKALYNATQDTTLSLKERKKAVDLLQEQYPSYFKNISDEIILAGKAEQQYEALTKSILAKAKAKAIEDDVTAIQKEIRELEKRKELNLEAEKIAALQFKRQTAINNKNIEGLKATNKLELDARKNSELFFQAEEGKAAVAKSIGDILSARAGIETNINAKLRDRNALEKELENNIRENGVDVLDDSKKTGDALDKIAEIYKKLAAELKSNPLQFGATKDDTAEANIKSYQTAIDGLIQNGYAPASKAVQDLINKQKELWNTATNNGGGILGPSSRDGMRGGAANRINSRTPILTPNLNLPNVKFVDEYQKAIDRAEESNKRFAESISTLAEAALSSGIGNAFASIGEAISSNGNVIEAFGKSIISSFAGFLSQLGQMFIKQGVATLLMGKAYALNPLTAALGASFISSGIGQIAAGSLISVGGGLLSGIGKGGSRSKVENEPSIRGFATGGYNLPSGLAMVGERGPELIDLPTGTSVHNNTKTNRMLEGMGGNGLVVNSSLGISMRELVVQIDAERKRMNR